ncbi:recombinase RecT [Anoxybacillus ayderensis]|uniref:recombinase RecT n=1 Tax=Anoxybacillus sp. ST70 TaxID=2864180 RepID=UPI00036F6968|nr:recombinase RecT [Anoxybacillus sp. ST70]AXM89362.1 recombinase RecT [Anoxybacillus ayderensis G10]MBW9219376.1 recombinase RecT [Anoxybacillus sp. ST70]THD16122.1 recombinase RecT [Anoxybacillus ayderensis]
MATTQSLKNQIAKKQNSNIQQGVTLKQLLNSESMKKRFEEVLGKRAQQFATSILNLYNSEKMLQKCEPMSIISSAMVAASLDLPVDKNLGYMYIVPYGTTATPIMGYRGYIQLALRTGQYKHINVIEVYEGELQKWDRLTEEFEMDSKQKKSDVVVGYAAYFELINGFRKTVYWTREQIEAHRKKYSKSDFGWKNDFDAMAKKTVLKSLLSKWGILSIEMQNAFNEDEKEVDTKEVKDITSEVQEAEYIEAEAFEVPIETETPQQEEIVFDAQ